jgi:ABC-type nitrate/sulfonate/bicarbonate transport system permease component
MMGTSDRKLLWKVIIPVSAPGILIGIQIALPISLIFEMVASGGLGYLEIQGVRGFDSPQVYAAIFAIRIVGLTLDRALRVVRRRLLAWT